MNYTISTNILEHQVSISVGTFYGTTFHDFDLAEGGQVIVDDKPKLKLIAKCCNMTTDMVLYLLEIAFEQAFNQYEDMILNKEELKEMYLNY